MTIVTLLTTLQNDLICKLSSDMNYFSHHCTT